MITPEAIAHRAGLLAQENEMDEFERLTKTLSRFAIDILGDYGVLPEAATNDPEFLDTCHVEAVAILAALRPTPALAAERMKREAAEICGKIDRGELGAAYWNVADCEQAILALPTGYTEAQLDAEAMARPKVRALIDASKWLGVCAQTTGGVAGRDEGLVAAVDQVAAALLDLKGAEHE